MAFMRPQQYNMTAGMQEVPDILSSAKLPRPIPVNVKSVAVASSTATQNSSGRVSFNLPGSANGFIKSGTVLLNFSFKVAGPASAAAGCVNFAVSGSAASVINRATLSIAGKSAERIDNYHLWHNILLLHASSSGYYDTDSKCMERLYDTPVVDAVATLGDINYISDAAILTGINYSVPIQLSLFNNQYGLPAFLFAPGSVQLDLDLNSVTEALCQGLSGATLVSEYTLSNCVLTYEIMEVPQDYVNGVRQGLAAGQNYTLPFISTRMNVTDNDITKTHNYGVNLSSLRSVLWFSRATKQLRSAIATGFDNACVGGLGRGCTGSATGDPVAVDLDYARLFCDGLLVNSRNYQSATEQFASLQTCFSKLNDSNITSASVMNRVTYPTTYFVHGINTTGADQQGYIFTGKPVSQVQLEIQRKNAVDAGNLYSVVVFDQLLLIDGMGQIELVQ